jgi:hypothetical protein
MKSITFHPRREFILWLILFVLCNLLNVYSIIHYKTRWIELITQLGYVFVLSLLIYFLIALIRLIVTLIRKKK